MKRSHMATRLTVHPDGSIENPHKWLCTSPIHYCNILYTVTLGNMSSDAGWRFATSGIPLNQVAKHLT